MESQILVEYYMVYPIISRIFLGNHIQDFIEVIVIYCLITPINNEIPVNYTQLDIGVIKRSNR